MKIKCSAVCLWHIKVFKTIDDDEPQIKWQKQTNKIISFSVQVHFYTSQTSERNDDDEEIHTQNEEIHYNYIIKAFSE